MVDALSTFPAMTGEHARVLERLKQLTAWQQAQQERLRAHQQLQIARLQGGGNSSSPPRLSLLELSSPSHTTMIRDEKEEEEETSNNDSGLETGCHGSEIESRLRTPSSITDEDRPIHPGLGERDTFEEMLERQLKLHPSDQATASQQKHKPHPFLKRGEGLARFGRVQRSLWPRRKQEKKFPQVHSANEMDSNSSHRMSSKENRGGGHQLGNQFSSEESFIIRGCQRFQQEAEELVEFEKLEAAALNTSSLSQCSMVVAGMLKKESSSHDPSDGVVEEEKEEDLDTTLTPSQTTEIDGEKEVIESLAAGMVFSDEEEWNSFSQSPPPPLAPPEVQVSSSGSSSPWSSPNRQNYTSSTPLNPSPQPPSHPEERELSPPPSSLTTQLFPALKSQPVLPAREETTPTAATPPRYPNEQEVKEKLAQLEFEINKFRRLNLNLEQQSKAKEDEVKHLKMEIKEFHHQMELEMKQFEQYKKEETNKLKKERRVFEAYVMERRSGQEKKDREEIEKLRLQVRELEEEIAAREERWRSAMGRQKQRVTALEDQNKELQADLRMMERERLSWWQQQLEMKRQQTPSPPPPSPPPPPLHVAANTALSKPRLAVKHKPKSKRAKNAKSAPETDTKPCNQPIKKEEYSANDKIVENEKKESSPLTIVEVVSRDLSPPDLWSGSDTGSDISALADDIVERVVGSSGGRENEERGQSTQDKEVKSVCVKSVRFAPEVKDDDERDQETVEENGSKVTVCSNGTRKIVSRDGDISLNFTNGDTKHIRPDGTIVYFYSQSQTTHTTHPDGVQQIEFPNHQTEKVYPDGKKEVRFPDGTVKTVEPSGEEKSVFADGTIQRLLLDGSREIQYTNGQREIHTNQFKRREYPDGTVKTVYPDGRQETRYSSGRLRVKDSSGTVLIDSWHQTHIMPLLSEHNK